MDNSVRDWAQEAVAQFVSTVMRSRRAVRAFKPQPLERKQVEDILADAATAPSGASLNIDRTDAAARARQSERNLSFFDAPVGLLFAIDRRLKPHSWIDLGMFAQNVMIAAKARGIDTCPQVSFAPFHDVIAAHLQLQPEEVTVFGMSMGYGDPDAPVNQPAMPRTRVNDFAQIVGFPEEHSGR
jgi:nitroreductase